MSDRQDAAQQLAEGAVTQIAPDGRDPVRGTVTAPDPAEGVSGAVSGAGGDVPAGVVQAVRREAAGYRVKLRETEAERDRLAARVERHDRVAAEALASEQMAAPADLWLDADLAAMRGEDGELDPELVSAEVDRVLRERPHWRKVALDFGGGARPPAPESGGFGAALKRVVTGE